MKLSTAFTLGLIGAQIPAAQAFSVLKTSTTWRSKTTGLRIASVERETSQSQHSKIDDELSFLSSPSASNIAELHSILDDGQGHINSELARSIWQWENSHLHSKNDDPFPAKRLRYSTRDGLRLIDDIARKLDIGNRHADLVQEGVVALMKCTVLWDERHTSKKSKDDEKITEDSFEAYAKKSIKKAMKKALTESSDNVNERTEVNLDLLKKRSLEQGMKSKTKAVDEDPQPHNQLTQPLSEAWEDANPTPIDIALSDMIRHDIGDFLVRQLSDMELKVIRLRFGLEKKSIGYPMSTQQIASSLDIAFADVLKLEEDGLGKLRSSFENDYIGAYIDDDHAMEVSL
jgi:RNA polymerase sigma factor (sigma-70 family)